MDGFLVINKEKNYTSRDIVNIICKEFNTKKVGHTGTLDPLASGVLVLGIGKGLKVSEFVTAYDKEYIAGVRLGVETDTLDITGNVTNKKKVNITKEDIEKVLNSFLGKSIQEVPKYSAVKVNGKRLYEYARNNIMVELPKREINVYDISLLEDIKYFEDYIEFFFKVKVSKGTYIRSLIRDIGRKLGSYACMTELKRIKQGNFDITNAYTLEEVRNNNYKILKIKDVLDMPVITVSEEDISKIKNGMVMNKFFKENMALICDKNGNELGIYQIYEKDKNKVKPYKIF